MIWKCKMPTKYPFYIIKENLCMIQIHNEDVFNLYKINEELQLEKTDFHHKIVSTNYFSIYIPSGPTILKADQSA